MIYKTSLEAFNVTRVHRIVLKPQNHHHILLHILYHYYTHHHILLTTLASKMRKKFLDSIHINAHTLIHTKPLKIFISTYVRPNKEKWDYWF